MFWRAYRLMAIAVVALPLDACITSNYDISAELKPEFPIKLGTYANKEAAVYDIRKGGNEYVVKKRDNKEITYARLYKIPEYSDYVFQFYNRKESKRYYMFIKTTEKGFDVYDVEKLADAVPEHVAKLLSPISDNDRSNNVIDVPNGKRDTLYAIREIMRANLKMMKIEKDSYERRP